jgi:Asp/Glu/Hydantoin racemase.
VSAAAAKIAVLCWEEGLVPRGLVQLEALPGNSTNPATYGFPVRFCRIAGATTRTVIEAPSRTVLKNMIAATNRLAAEGVCAVTTSCGFNVIFQNELSRATDAAIFTSSLLQVPFVRRILAPRDRIAVITANGPALRAEHLRAAGISEDMNVEVFGLETCAEWNRIFTATDETADLGRVSEEVVEAALRAQARRPDIGAFVLECTDLPPFSAAIRQATGLPVYDFTTMVRMVASSYGCVESF